jgi:SET domain-containing protein
MSGTTIYDLEQVVWEKSFTGEASKNPQAIGKNRLSTIAYIAPAHQGNWTRFMNHSCDSNVNFRHTVVGKYATTVIEAKRDIAIFEEITANYGKNYWAAAGRICKCGSGGCIHRERP